MAKSPGPATHTSHEGEKKSLCKPCSHPPQDDDVSQGTPWAPGNSYPLTSTPATRPLGFDPGPYGWKDWSGNRLEEDS